MASKFKKKETTKEKIKKETWQKVKDQAKHMYPVSEGDIKMLKAAVKDSNIPTKVKQIKLIKELKKRYDKVKD